jgi:hypothetical protein
MTHPVTNRFRNIAGLVESTAKYRRAFATGSVVSAANSNRASIVSLITQPPKNADC